MRICAQTRSLLDRRGVSTARVGHRATETRSELASSSWRRAHQLTREHTGTATGLGTLAGARTAAQPTDWHAELFDVELRRSVYVQRWR